MFMLDQNSTHVFQDRVCSFDCDIIRLRTSNVTVKGRLRSSLSDV